MLVSRKMTATGGTFNFMKSACGFSPWCAVVLMVLIRVWGEDCVGELISHFNLSRAPFPELRFCQVLGFLKMSTHCWDQVSLIDILYNIPIMKSIMCIRFLMILIEILQNANLIILFNLLHLSGHRNAFHSELIGIARRPTDVQQVTQPLSPVFCLQSRVCPLIASR